MEAEHFGLWGFASVGFTGSVRYQPIPMTAPTCSVLGQMAVHGAMAGYSGITVSWTDSSSTCHPKKSEAYKMVDVIILRFHDGVEATVCSLQKLRSCFWVNPCITTLNGQRIKRVHSFTHVSDRLVRSIRVTWPNYFVSFQKQLFGRTSSPNTAVEIPGWLCKQDHIICSLFAFLTSSGSPLRGYCYLPIHAITNQKGKRLLADHEKEQAREVVVQIHFRERPDFVSRFAAVQAHRAWYNGCWNWISDDSSTPTLRWKRCKREAESWSIQPDFMTAPTISCFDAPGVNPKGRWFFRMQEATKQPDFRAEA